MGIVADAVVQYAIMVYGKKRCRRQIEDAHLLQNELQHFSPSTQLENDYTLSSPSYHEEDVLRRYIQSQDHLAVIECGCWKICQSVKR